jgi:thymidylate synthase (FAD)
LTLSVSLVDKMGDDTTVVNSARVSFGKRVDQFRENEDEKLIKYLASNNHWSPFSHCFLQFHVKAPIFVARQLAKHQIGLAWNEISRRYVDTEPQFYTPSVWRKKADDKKQGSSNEEIKYDISGTMKYVTETYNNLLDEGVAPEMARMILPLSLMTEWYWSGSLSSFARASNLRLADSSQKETQLIAQQISNLAAEHFPISWKYLILSKWSSDD